jgi:hypothetical protein
MWTVAEAHLDSVVLNIDGKLQTVRYGVIQPKFTCKSSSNMQGYVKIIRCLAESAAAELATHLVSTTSSAIWEVVPAGTVPALPTSLQASCIGADQQHTYVVHNAWCIC